MLDATVNPKIEQLIAEELLGLNDFAKLAKLSELIEVFSREVPAMLAEMRVDQLRKLREIYTNEQIRAGTGLSDNRIRKLADR